MGAPTHLKKNICQVSSVLRQALSTQRSRQAAKQSNVLSGTICYILSKTGYGTTTSLIESGDKTGFKQDALLMACKAYGLWPPGLGNVCEATPLISNLHWPWRLLLAVGTVSLDLWQILALKVTLLT